MGVHIPSAEEMLAVSLENEKIASQADSVLISIITSINNAADQGSVGVTVECTANNAVMTYVTAQLAKAGYGANISRNSSGNYSLNISWGSYR